MSYKIHTRANFLRKITNWQLHRSCSGSKDTLSATVMPYQFMICATRFSRGAKDSKTTQSAKSLLLLLYLALHFRPLSFAKHLFEVKSRNDDVEWVISDTNDELCVVVSVNGNGNESHRRDFLQRIEAAQHILSRCRQSECVWREYSTIFCALRSSCVRCGNMRWVAEGMRGNLLTDCDSWIIWGD